MFHILIHIIAIANFAYSIYWEMFILPLKDPRYKPGSPKAFGGQWKFLTFLNLWLQLIYFVISLLNSIFGTHASDKKSASTLQKMRDFLFATLAFPIGQFVGIIFWTLFHINRELVFPLALDEIFPNYVNHMLHSTVIPLQLLELILLHHIYPRKKLGMATIFIFIASYLAWTLIVAHFGGFWVYPIFKVLGPVQRAIFMFFCSLSGGFLYLIGEGLNNFVWSKKIDLKSEEEPQKVD